MKRIIILAALALGGCATQIPADPSKMSAEQLDKWIKDKSASVSCVSGKTAAGNVSAVYVNIDKSTLPASASSVVVDPDCKVTIGTPK